MTTKNVSHRTLMRRINNVIATTELGERHGGRLCTGQPRRGQRRYWYTAGSMTTQLPGCTTIEDLAREYGVLRADEICGG